MRAPYVHAGSCAIHSCAEFVMLTVVVVRQCMHVWMSMCLQTCACEQGVCLQTFCWCYSEHAHRHSADAIHAHMHILCFHMNMLTDILLMLFTRICIYCVFTWTWPPNKGNVHLYIFMFVHIHKYKVENMHSKSCFSLNAFLSVDVVEKTDWRTDASRTFGAVWKAFCPAQGWPGRNPHYLERSKDRKCSYVFCQAWVCL